MIFLIIVMAFGVVGGGVHELNQDRVEQVKL